MEDTPINSVSALFRRDGGLPTGQLVDLRSQRLLKLESHVGQILLGEREIMELALVHVGKGVFVIDCAVVEVAVDVVAPALVDYVD